MKGFEIRINEEQPIFATSDNLVDLIINIGYQKTEDYVYIGDLDSKFYPLYWLRRLIHTGDRIKIRVCEFAEASPLSERYPSDREEMKKKYDELKKQLEEEGVL